MSSSEIESSSPGVPHFSLNIHYVGIKNNATLKKETNMSNDEFTKRLAEISRIKEETNAKLETFEKDTADKLNKLIARRDQVVPQLRELYKGDSSAECTDGGVSASVQYAPADLRNKTIDRSLITVTINDRSSRPEHTYCAKINLLETINIGAIDSLESAHKVAKVINDLEEFVKLAERAVELWLNHECAAAILQKDFLEKFNKETNDEW